MLRLEAGDALGLPTQSARTIEVMALFKTKEAGPVSILGNQMTCEICGHDQFYQREGKISTTGMTLLDLDWLNQSANCVVCATCGYVHWFLPTP